MALTHLEEQLVWLTGKIRRDRDYIARAVAFFEEKQYDWPRGITNLFLITIEKMNDQLYFEENQLEKIAWEIVEAREGSEYITRNLPRGRYPN